MKKRSLFAAVAMLIVSAIVLTSATYAWFAARSTASVGALSASVTNSDGNLLVKATGTYAVTGSDFKGAITSADYTGYPTELNPVSFRKSGTGNLMNTTPIAVNYDGAVFTPGTLVNPATDGNDKVEYQHYSFQVKYTTNDTSVAKKVTATPTFTRGGNFMYCYVETSYNGTTNGYWYGSDSYYPVVSAITANTSITDVKTGDPAANNAIIDSTGAENAGNNVATTAITTDDTASFDLMSGLVATESSGTVTAGTGTATVDVYIWAEGQDPQCTGTNSAAGTGISFQLGASDVTVTP
jgi:hypothetical protein